MRRQLCAPLGHRAVGLAPIVLVMVAALALLGAGAASADADALRLRAEALAGGGNCGEALQVLERARREAPGDARVALVRGQCEIQLKRFVDAVASLEEAKRLDPALPGVDLYLGIAQYHVGDLGAAEASLEAARTRGPDRAELELYRGLILLQRAETADAATALERARSLDPDAVEPVASYYAGLAWAGAQELASAEDALTRVQSLAPGSVWANEAELALSRLAAVEPGRWFASLTAGIEYDSNVVLEGTGVALPRGISSSSDYRGVWSLEAGTEFLRTRDWSAGALVRYYGSAHDDIDEFDTHFPRIMGWLDRRLGEGVTARAQYEFGYAWVDGLPFRLSHNGTLALYKDWGSAKGTSRLFADFVGYHFYYPNFDVPNGVGVAGSRCPIRRSPGGVRFRYTFCGPPGVNEERERDRSGWGALVGLGHEIPVVAERLVLRGRYSYGSYESDGTEYTFDAHQFRIGARAKLPLDFVLDTAASYTFRPYHNASTFPDPSDVPGHPASLIPPNGTQYRLSSSDRSDNVWEFDVSLEKRLTRFLTGAVRYSYIDNNSNVDVFDYNRNIVGAYLTLEFHNLGG